MELSSSSPSPLPLQEAAWPNGLAQGSKSAGLKERRATQKWKRAIQRNLSGYLFLLPALLIFALFVWYPVVSGFLMSFQSVDLINPSRWVGFANYREVFSDPLFGLACRNTLAFTLSELLLGYLSPIVLAFHITMH